MDVLSKDLWREILLRSNVLKIVFTLAGLSIGANATQAAENKFLSGLTGSWTGKGFVTTNAKSKEEAIRCRLINRTEKKTAKLILTGNCGVAGILLPMTGWVLPSSKANRFTASMFRNLNFVSVEQFRGRLRGKKLDLKFEGRDKVNKVDISANIIIKKSSADKFVISLGRTDGKSKKYRNVGKINFSRK